MQKCPAAPNTPRAELSKITRSALLSAIDTYDRRGECGFFALLKRVNGAGHVKPGRRFFVQVGDRLYHSKALVSYAYNFVPDGRVLRSDEFSGGAARLAPVFRRCGLTLWDARERAEVA